MQKQINDFPDLNSDYYLERLDIQHFTDGLSPSIVFTEEHRFFKAIYLSIVPESEPSHPGVRLNEGTSILSYLLKNQHIFYVTKEKKELVISFVEKTLLELQKENKLTPRQFLDIALDSVTHSKRVLEFLLVNKMFDVDSILPDGTNLLMHVEDKSIIELLVQHGINSSYTINHREHIYHGLEAYDIAIKRKKKGLISYLLPYASKTTILKNENNLLEIFKKESHYKNQIKIFITSLKENNHTIAQAIMENPTKYKDMIEHIDSHGKTLIHHACTANNKEILEKLITLAYYAQNKDKIIKKNSFAVYALTQNRNSCAKVLIDAHYYNCAELNTYLENTYNAHPLALCALIDTGCDPSIELRFKHQCLHNLREKLSRTNSEELNIFFDHIKPYMRLKPLRFYNGKSLYIDLTRDLLPLKSNHIRFICQVFKRQKELNEKLYYQYFSSFLNSFEMDDEEVSKYIGLSILSELPEEKTQILNHFSNFSNREWTISLVQQELHSVLTKFKENETKKYKI